MKIVDLTHFISSDMPVFPGTEKPKLEDANTIENDGFRETKITFYSHTGTHIDAPAHMLKNGLSLDKLPLEKFSGKAIIINIEDQDLTVIDTALLKRYEEKIKSVEFVILKTDWDRYWGNKKYFEAFPSLSTEAAIYLSNFNLKGIGIDALSIDPINSTTFKIHNTLMKKDMIIIENLTNLASISEEYFILNVFPLKSKNADGSPVRAVGIES